MGRQIASAGVFDAETMKWLRREWFSKEGYLDGGLRMLKPRQETAIRKWINEELFDYALGKPAGSRIFNVTWRSPGTEWEGTALMPLYSETGQDEERAARLYGLLVCRIAIERADALGEIWYTFKQEISEDRPTSRSYVLRG
jgi:hypothetical protein